MSGWYHLSARYRLRLVSVLGATLLACGSSRAPQATDPNVQVPVANGNAADPIAAPGDTDGQGNAGDGNVAYTPGNVRVVGTGFAALEGMSVSVKVATQLQTILGGASSKVANGGFDLQTRVNNAGAVGQQLYYYVDKNANGWCNLAPLDVGGNATIPSDGVVRLSYAAEARPRCEPFGNYSLQLKGRNFGYANGHQVVAAVADRKDGAFVAGPITAPIADAVWALRFQNLLLESHDYEVRVFVDLDGSGQCQGTGFVLQYDAAKADQTGELRSDSPRTAVCPGFPPF